MATEDHSAAKRTEKHLLRMTTGEIARADTCAAVMGISRNSAICVLLRAGYQALQYAGTLPPPAPPAPMPGQTTIDPEDQ